MKKLTLGLLIGCGVLSAQTPAENQERTRMRAGPLSGLAPIYRVTVTERTAKAISYQHRSGATKIDFDGTALMPNAHGEAKVESKKGYIEIEVEFRQHDATPRNSAASISLTSCGPSLRRAARPIWARFSAAAAPTASWT